MFWVVRGERKIPDFSELNDGYAALFSDLSKKMGMLVKSLVAYPSTVIETKTQVKAAELEGFSFRL